MENLAGNKQCDETIRRELETAGITVLELGQARDAEVPSSLMGVLGPFIFTRAWYYWVVKGDVPLSVADKMYGDPAGEDDVRVAGNCGCPPPNEWAFPKIDVLFALGVCKGPSDEHSIGEGPTNSELAEMCNSGRIKAPRFVSGYHIDTQEGLNLFSKTMRESGLVHD